MGDAAPPRHLRCAAGLAAARALRAGRDALRRAQAPGDHRTEPRCDCALPARGVAGYMGRCVLSGRPAIVLEWLKTSLHDLLHKQSGSKDGSFKAKGGASKAQPLNDRTLARIAREVATGVAYLHAEQLIHRVRRCRLPPDAEPRPSNPPPPLTPPLTLATLTLATLTLRPHLPPAPSPRTLHPRRHLASCSAPHRAPPPAHRTAGHQDGQRAGRSAAACQGGRLWHLDALRPRRHRAHRRDGNVPVHGARGDPPPAGAPRPAPDDPRPYDC